MPIELLCRNVGMTRLFDDAGDSIPVTVLEAGPNVVVQKKTEQHDGYSALQLGFGDRREALFSKPEKGHFEKAGIAPRRYLHESRVDAAELEKHELGSEIKADLFSVGQYVDAIGTSKGRGWAGVVKRHHIPMSKASHGTHEYFRHGGSIGPGSFPGHVIKGLRMAGHMGSERVTIRNLRVVKVEPERNLLFVRGSVPGHRDGLVIIREAVKSPK